MSPPSRFKRAGEIAKIIGVDVRTVRRWIADGSLRSVRIGGSRFVTDDELHRRFYPNLPSQSEDEGETRL